MKSQGNNDDVCSSISFDNDLFIWGVLTDTEISDAQFSSECGPPVNLPCPHIE